MQKQDKISIIVPCHNEEEVLPLFLKEIEKIRVVGLAWRSQRLW